MKMALDVTEFGGSTLDPMFPVVTCELNTVKTSPRFKREETKYKAHQGRGKQPGHNYQARREAQRQKTGKEPEQKHIKFKAKKAGGTPSRNKRGPKPTHPPASNTKEPQRQKSIEAKRTRRSWTAKANSKKERNRQPNVSWNRIKQGPKPTHPPASYERAPSQEIGRKR